MPTTQIVLENYTITLCPFNGHFPGQPG